MLNLLLISPLIRRSALFLLAFVVLNATAVTVTWTNTAGGNWSLPANWSPNQVPASNDDVLITTPGTYTVYYSSTNPPTVYITNAASLTLGAGGGAAGVQAFIVTNISDASFYAPFYVRAQLLVTNGGVFQVTQSGVFANPLLVAKGGVLNATNAALDASLTLVNGGSVNTTNGLMAAVTRPELGPPAMIVTNGGVLNANGDVLGSVMVANGGICLANGVTVSTPYLGQPFAVIRGGLLNITNGLGLYSPFTNSGTVNLIGSGIGIENFYAPGNQYGDGGLVNQAGGVINLQGSSSINGAGRGIYQVVLYDYFLNQGVIAASGGTNSISCEIFDNTLGTITNSSGTLALGTYQSSLAGNYFASSGATIQFNAVNDGTNFVTTGTPLALAGSGSYQFVSGDLRLTNNAYPNLDLIGSTLVLGPGFQGGAITNLELNGMFLSNSLPVTGSLAATNSVIQGTFTVASGGFFNENGVDNQENLTLANKGVLNLTGAVKIRTALTNAGTVNMSNTAVSLYNSPLLNQAGGVMNFLGGGSSVSFYYGTGNFINLGNVSQNAPGATNTIVVPGFDTSLGTVTNLAGTLLLEGFQASLAGTYFAAPGATIQLIGGTASAPLSPGAPLVLGGGGQYQFLSDIDRPVAQGFLYLSANVPANLFMQGGILELGPNFQGGAITNLTLNGIALTNQLGTTLPITGQFTLLNSGGLLYAITGIGPAELYPTGLYGNYTVANGGILTVSNSFLRGAVSVMGGGLMDLMGGTAYGPVSVAGGGQISVPGGNQSILVESSLFIGTGGTMNISKHDIAMAGPLNNSGTINITNASPETVTVINNVPATLGSGFEIENDGPGGVIGLGGITNQASGLINLNGDNTHLNGSLGGYEYIFNQGQITKSAGSSFTFLLVPNLTNSGAITVQSGLVAMHPFAIHSGGSLNAGLNSAASYGSFFITSTGPALTGTQTLAGAFNAVLNNGYVPTNGTVFNVLAYGAEIGAFASLGLPSGETWQSNYGTTNFTLVAGSGRPVFAAFNRSGTNLIFYGTGGMTGSNYVVLASTNLSLPFTNWTALTTNQFDGSGQLHFTNPINAAKPRQFFIFRTP